MSKKVLSIIVAVAVVCCGFSGLFIVNAASGQSNATPAVPEGAVYEIIYEHPRYPTRGLTGNELRYNAGAADSLISHDILAITYSECFISKPNQYIVGLPYDSVDKVRAISYVESVEPYDPFTVSEVSPENKVSEELKAFAALHDGEPITLEVSLCYDSKKIFIGADKYDYENPMEYEALERNRTNRFYTENNQKCFAMISEKIDAELVKDYRFYEPQAIIIAAHAEDVMTIAQMDFVDGVKTAEYDPLTEPTQPPIERPANLFFINVLNDGISEAFANHKAVVGSSVALYAKPAEGYRFVQWHISGEYSVREGDLDQKTCVIFPASDITATAEFQKEAAPPIDLKDYKCADRFEAWMAAQYIEKAESDDAPIHYGEVIDYRAYKELAQMDYWVLLEAHVVGLENPWEMVLSIEFGDRILSWWEPGAGIYPYGLFVYDASQDTFFPIEDVKPEDYAGLSDSISELMLGRPLGDADNDSDLTIMDATCIQRDLAELAFIDEETDIYRFTAESAVKRFSDFDCDNDITILDATAIQRRLAGLE